MIVAISIIKEQIPLIEAMCGTVITASYIYDCTVASIHLVFGKYDVPGVTVHLDAGLCVEYDLDRTTHLFSPIFTYNCGQVRA